MVPFCNSYDVCFSCFSSLCFTFFSASTVRFNVIYATIFCFSVSFLCVFFLLLLFFPFSLNSITNLIVILLNFASPILPYVSTPPPPTSLHFLPSIIALLLTNKRFAYAIINHLFVFVLFFFVVFYLFLFCLFRFLFEENCRHGKGQRCSEIG